MNGAETTACPQENIEANLTNLTTEKLNSFSW